MLISNQQQPGFEITNIETCDFRQLAYYGNEDVFRLAGRHAESGRLARFIEKTMGIVGRYHCPPEMDAYDNAHSALARLLEKDPSLRQRAEFFIYVGISNPRPVSTLSALLAGEFGFENASCWDLKSGCSTGVLSLLQAQSWIAMGAKCGVIVSSETLSKFSPPDVMQISAATGDGAVALSIEASSQWQLKSVVHGTDPRYANSIRLPGKFPVDFATAKPEDYLYQLDAKGSTIEMLQKYWMSSLGQLFESAGITGIDVAHYIAHQVDGSKNEAIALAGGIPAAAIAKNFERFGNMGAPTVLINYYQWINRPEHKFASGDHLVWHSVGGGISWAGLCLQHA